MVVARRSFWICSSHLFMLVGIWKSFASPGPGTSPWFDWKSLACVPAIFWNGNKMLNLLWYWMAFLGDPVYSLKWWRRIKLQGAVWLPEIKVQLFPWWRGTQSLCAAIYWRQLDLISHFNTNLFSFAVLSNYHTMTWKISFLLTPVSLQIASFLLSALRFGKELR